MARPRKINGKTPKRYKENPFLEHTAEISTTGWKPKYVNPHGGIAVLSEVTGEIHGAAVVYKEEVDKTEFVKVYAEGVAAILSLKSAGKKVFQIIYSQLIGKNGVGRTEIVLNYEMLPDEIQKGISAKTFSRGIGECLKADLIAQTLMQGLYFVNPAFIFNGNRLNIVRQFVIKEEKRADIADQAALEAVKNQDVSK